MEINFKYNVGQEVFFLNKENRCESAVVKSVNVFIYEDETHITYNVGDMVGKEEQEIFDSQTALRDYVFPEVTNINDAEV